MKPARVVITGLGTISALGKNHPEFWSALLGGQSAIAAIEQVNCSDLRFKMGAEVKSYHDEDYFDAKQITWMDRFTQFALIAAQEAVDDARLNINELANSQTAIITGSCLGGKITEDKAFYRYYHQNNKRTSPTLIPTSMANAGASQIAATFGITGPAYTISTACSSSTHAIGNAFWLIRQGVVNCAITGGSETPFSPAQLSSWEALRVIASDTCRPFSKNRSGMILGEGGAMLILESLDSALNRGANIYAELVGFGMSADATHLTIPNSLGQEQAVLAALNDAGITADAVNYINAHGTGTLINDQVETKTIQRVFPYANKHLKVSSTKGAHGHLLGATGAIETIATALTLKHQIIPPTVNFLDTDPDCDLPLIVNEAQESSLDYALCSSFAFGGLNAILVLRRFPGPT